MDYTFDNVHPALICSICHGILDDPRETPRGHVFCRACITRWLAEDPRCPISKDPLSLAALRKPNAAFHALLDDVVVKCGLCAQSLRRGAIKSHVGSQCGASASAAQAHTASTHPTPPPPPPPPPPPIFEEGGVEDSKENGKHGLQTPHKPTTSALVTPTPSQLPLGVRRVYADGAAADSPAPAKFPAQKKAVLSNVTNHGKSLSPPSQAAACCVSSDNADDCIPGLTYEFFAGSFDMLPNFDELAKPTQAGITPLCSLQALIDAQIINCAAQQGLLDMADFALRLSGYIVIAKPGSYRFTTSSNDGSELYINGRAVVNNDGKHYVTKKQGNINLDAGRHSFVLGYFHKNGKLMEGVRGGPCLDATIQRVSDGGWSFFGAEEDTVERAIPPQLLCTSGKYRRDALERTISPRSRNMFKDLTEQCHRLEADLKRVTETAERRVQAAEKKVEDMRALLASNQSVLSAQLKTVQDSQQQEQAKRATVETELASTKKQLQRCAADAQHQQSQVFAEWSSQYQVMGRHFFSALALALKQQLGDTAYPISSTALYCEAARRQIPAEQWPSFIVCALTRGEIGLLRHCAGSTTTADGADDSGHPACRLQLYSSEEAQS